MINLLAEVDRFELWHRAVRRQFQEGTSTARFLFAFLALAALVAFVYWLSQLQGKIQKKVEGTEDFGDPQRLFGHLLYSLGLSVPQRQMLEAVAKEAQLPHPTVVLLSESLFDRHVREWKTRMTAKHGSAEEVSRTQLIAKTRARLFPDGTGMVFTPTSA